MKIDIKLTPEQKKKFDKRFGHFGDTPEQVVKKFIEPLIEASEEDFEYFLNMRKYMDSDEFKEEMEEMMENDEMLDDEFFEDENEFFGDDDDDDDEFFDRDDFDKERYN